MVKFLNEKSCFIGDNVKIGENVVIYENNHIEGNCTIGDNCTLLPNNFIKNCEIGENCTLHSSVLEDSTVKSNVSIGPFAWLRPIAQSEKVVRLVI